MPHAPFFGFVRVIRDPPERFHLFQASIYEMPFPDNSFHKVFCLGVLQHTPDFEQSIQSLVQKAKTGGEIVVVPAAANNATMIGSVLDMTQPGGGTPTSDTLDRVITDFADVAMGPDQQPTEVRRLLKAVPQDRPP